MARIHLKQTMRLRSDFASGSPSFSSGTRPRYALGFHLFVQHSTFFGDATIRLCLHCFVQLKRTVALPAQLAAAQSAHQMSLASAGALMPRAATLGEAASQLREFLTLDTSVEAAWGTKLVLPAAAPSQTPPFAKQPAAAQPTWASSTAQPHPVVASGHLQFAVPVR